MFCKIRRECRRRAAIAVHKVMIGREALTSWEVIYANVSRKISSHLASQVFQPFLRQESSRSHPWAVFESRVSAQEAGVRFRAQDMIKSVPKSSGDSPQSMTACKVEAKVFPPFAGEVMITKVSASIRSWRAEPRHSPRARRRRILQHLCFGI